MPIKYRKKTVKKRVTRKPYKKNNKKSLVQLIKKVSLKQSETKHTVYLQENIQLNHNSNAVIGSVLATTQSVSDLSNSTNNTACRIGDQVKAVGVSFKFWFANKLDKGIEGPKDIPIIKEFFSDPSNPMMVQKYHTNIATIYGAHRLEQMYVKGPERDLIKLQEVRTERGNELRMYAQAQDVERQLKSLRVRLRVAQNKEDTGREKELKERMNKVQEQFNKMFEQKVK